MSAPEVVPFTFGRDAFGADPEGYERARPAYPEAIYDVLRERCGLRPGISVLEIGPGPGVVTKRLVEAGVASIMAVEPDARLGAYLRRRFAGTDLTVIESIFEEAVLPAGAFDLAVSGTAFHWVDPAVGVAKMAGALAPGGWWGCFWNFFRDPEAEDPFMEATRHLFRDVPRAHDMGRTPGGETLPFGLQTGARLAELAAEPRLSDARAQMFRWTQTMSADAICALFASFSPMVAMEPEARAAFLAKVHAIATEQFGGSVEKPMCASLYTAQRR